MILAISIAFLLIYLAYIFIFRPFYILYFFYARQGLLIPKGYLPIFGHYFQRKKDKYSFIRKLYDQNGGLVPWSEGLRTFLYVGDPIKAQKIIELGGSMYHIATRGGYKALGSFAKITLTDPSHPNINIRKAAVQKAFSRAYQQAMQPEFFKVLVDNYQKFKDQHQEIQFKCELGSITENIILKFGQEFVFGPDIQFDQIKFYNKNNNKVEGSFIQLCQHSCEPFTGRFIARQNFFGIFENLSFSQADRSLEKNMTILQKTFQNKILERITLLKSQSEVKDISGLLLNELKAQKINVNDEEIISYISLIFMSLLPTIPAIVCNTALNLSVNPELQKKVYQETQQIFGSTDNLTADLIDKFQIINFCVKETLRFCAPLVQFSSIQIKQNLDIDGIIINKDDIITFDAHYIQTRDDLWYEPMKYNPDRFNPSHKFYKRPNGEKRHSFDYMPFFVGMRACAGKSFSYLLGCTLLALLVKDFKFLPQNKEDLIERPIYKNEYKFPEIRLKKRNS